MTPKKLLLPPLLPVALLLLLCGWVFCSEITGEARMIGGSPDNAPARAAAILAIASPVIYILFALCNLIDAAVDRLKTNPAWLSTAALIIVSGLLLSWRLYAPNVDSTPGFAIGSGFVLSLVIFAPMSIIRRCFIRSRAKS